MNGELTKHMVKKPFYSVDYFFMDDVYADGGAAVGDLTEIFKYTSSVAVEFTHDGNDHIVESVSQYFGLLSYMKNGIIGMPKVETFRFKLDKTKQTWFDLANDIRVTKQEIVC